MEWAATLGAQTLNKGRFSATDCVGWELGKQAVLPICIGAGFSQPASLLGVVKADLPVAQ